MNASGGSELSRLVVFDRLEVGPVKVEGDRIAASYRLGEDSFELAYKYEEPVFDPQDPEASNLASVIPAQVALNYGLFCREIVFHGDFDETDRRFLTEMATQLINRDAHIFTCVDTGETSDAEVNAMSEVPNDVHAGDIETSTTLAVRPELVRMDRAEKFIPHFSSKYLDFTARGGVGWYAQTAKITPSGVFGDPTRATREKGERMWEVMVEHLVALVTSIQGLSLDEIHQSSEARRAPSSPSGSEGSEPREERGEH